MTTFYSPSGLNELSDALKSWRVWCSLAIQDILIRYRGSTLGPFWITISTAITAYSMGYLYGFLFHIDRMSYLPYFTTGIIAWTFISMVINESTKIFIDSKPYMENIQLSCIVYVFRLVLRNIIIFFHNLPVFISIAFLYQMKVDANLLLLIPSLFILSLNGLFFGTLIALISTRFPDVGSIIFNILQVVFFITPIMWSPVNVPEKFHFYLILNPFYYFISLIRNPLLSQPFSIQELTGITVLTCLGLCLFLPIVKTYSKRVIFWL